MTDTTQQALRELVAKWRKTFEEQKDNSTYFVGWGDACSSHADELEALLGEQREAQGAVEYLKEAVSLAASMASDLRDKLDFDDNDDHKYRAAKDIETHLLGTLIGLEDFPKTAPPLAESADKPEAEAVKYDLDHGNIGDVWDKAIARLQKALGVSEDFDDVLYLLINAGVRIDRLQAEAPPLPSDKLRGLVRKWRKESEPHQFMDSRMAGETAVKANCADELEALLSQEPSSGEAQKPACWAIYYCGGPVSYYETEEQAKRSKADRDAIHNDEELRSIVPLFASPVTDGGEK